MFEVMDPGRMASGAPKDSKEYRSGERPVKQGGPEALRRCQATCSANVGKRIERKLGVRRGDGKPSERLAVKFAAAGTLGSPRQARGLACPELFEPYLDLEGVDVLRRGRLQANQ